MWKSGLFLRSARSYSASAVVAGMLSLVSAPLVAQSATATMPDSIRGYVRDAMTLFRTNSVHQAEVDWRALEDSVITRSAGAQTPDDTWAALTWALRRVDQHSFLMPPPSRMAGLTGMMAPPPRAQSGGGASSRTAHLLENHVAWIAVPPHAGPNCVSYVDSLHAQLTALDQAGVCGWIVDLRDNTGGNLWPMLAGIGPLLGAEVVGSLTNSPPGVVWRYRDGRSWSGDSTLPTAFDGWGTSVGPKLTHGDAPVALLIGRKTASSGEMTTLAFLGRRDVRSFGDSTAGYASSNKTLPLRDGATLIVTSAYPRDRLGRRYPLHIAPDELVAASDSTDDAPMRRASTWLRQQPACAKYR